MLFHQIGERISIAVKAELVAACATGTLVTARSVRKVQFAKAPLRWTPHR